MRKGLNNMKRLEKEQVIMIEHAIIVNYTCDNCKTRIESLVWADEASAGIAEVECAKCGEVRYYDQDVFKGEII